MSVSEKSAKSPVSEAAFSLALSALTAGLLLYLLRSGLVCPPEASSCMISATLAEGLLVLIPLLIGRYAFDMVIQLVVIFRRGFGRLAVGLQLVLGLADSGIIVYMLLSGLRSFVRVDWLAGLWQLPFVAALAGPAFSLVMIGLLILQLRVLYRQLRNFNSDRQES